MNKNFDDLSGMKILVVDSIPANVNVLRQTLEPQGYKIFAAPNGEVALKIIAGNLPDLILLDVMLPGIDGFETCRQLKSNDATNGIPVIFVTAKTEINDIVHGFRLGGIDYITKPFHQDEVLIRIKTHLRLRKLFLNQVAYIKELKELKEKFELYSKTDSLTGLPNRRGMDVELQNEINRFKRKELSFAIILCDIDFFKEVNDQYGHDAGDKVLIHVAHILKEVSRSQDIACRWGGEEFVVLLPETGLEGVIVLAEKLRKRIKTAKITYRHSDIFLTMSFGVSVYDESTASIESCINIADECLYKAKSSGRDKVVGQNDKID